MDRNRETATLNYEISAVWETKPGTTSGLSVGLEQVTRHKTVQDMMIMMMMVVVVMIMMMVVVVVVVVVMIMMMMICSAAEE